MNDILVSILLVIIIGSAALLLFMGKPEQYIKKEFMNRKEQQLYKLLVHTFPNLLIFPHVAMASIVTPSDKMRSKKRDALMQQLANHYTAFSIFDSDYEFICAVEFKSQNGIIKREKNSEISRLLKECSIRTIFISPYGLPEAEDLKEEFQLLMNDRNSLKTGPMFSTFSIDNSDESESDKGQAPYRDMELSTDAGSASKLASETPEKPSTDSEPIPEHVESLFLNFGPSHKQNHEEKEQAAK